jgi:hypothetical protein
MKPLHSYVGEVLTDALRAEMESRFGFIHVVTPDSPPNRGMTGAVVKVNGANIIIDTAVF